MIKNISQRNYLARRTNVNGRWLAGFEPGYGETVELTVLRKYDPPKRAENSLTLASASRLSARS